MIKQDKTGLILDDGSGLTNNFNGKLLKISLESRNLPSTARLIVKSPDGELIHDSEINTDEFGKVTYYPHVVMEQISESYQRTDYFYIIGSLWYELTGIGPGEVIIKFYYETDVKETTFF